MRHAAVAVTARAAVSSQRAGKFRSRAPLPPVTDRQSRSDRDSLRGARRRQ
jgi:hypothetical protein